MGVKYIYIYICLAFSFIKVNISLQSIFYKTRKCEERHTNYQNIHEKEKKNTYTHK